MREGRLNYANLASLAGVVNALGSIREAPEMRSTTDALGLTPDEIHLARGRHGSQPAVAHPRPEGLLARAKGLTTESLLHWSRMEDR
jgi:hypothetical protein